MSARGTREAIAGLPLANPAQAAREIEQMLDAMLAITWPGAERIAALEELRVPVAGLCADIERRLGVESHPLPPASAEWAATAQRLQFKLASLYAIGLHELCAPAGKLPMFKGKTATLAAVHGLVHTDHALLWAYRRYQVPPRGLWQHAHALYGFAAELGVADQEAADEIADGVRINARDAYAHLLLFAISNPYRYSSRELDEARQVCRSVAGLLVFARGGAGIPVDTDSDSGPGYVPEERVAAGDGVIALDIAPVEQSLDERIAALPRGVEALELPRQGGGRVATSAGFLRRLRAGWGTAARGHVRLAASHALDIVVGMHALHYALAGDMDFASFVRQVHGDAITVGLHDLPTTWIAAADSAQPRVFRGEVLDQSEGGYQLRLPIAEGLRMRIGDMVGLAPVVEGADARDWMVGVIRWLRQDDESVLLGIELLRREARAAGLRVVTASGEVMAPQRAVELLDGADDGSLSLLLTHPFAANAATVEVALPKLASDWSSRAAVASWQPGTVEALGPSCFRVTLVRDNAIGDG